MQGQTFKADVLALPLDNYDLVLGVQWLIEQRFEFELPDVSDDYLPLYGGKIWVKGDNGEKLSIPYGGMFCCKWCSGQSLTFQ